MGDQPPNSELTDDEPLDAEVLLALEELLAAWAPESVRLVALTVPLAAGTPATTTESPGLILERPTVWALVILVALDRVTLTVLPEVSVT